jgi:uncharacterized membrane protein HdeD (DUF308 family)
MPIVSTMLRFAGGVSLLVAAAALALGLSILFHPVAGARALTILMGLLQRPRRI